jgi:hypothetical protein
VLVLIKFYCDYKEGSQQMKRQVLRKQKRDLISKVSENFNQEKNEW